MSKVVQWAFKPLSIQSVHVNYHFITTTKLFFYTQQRLVQAVWRNPNPTYGCVWDAPLTGCWCTIFPLVRPSCFTTIQVILYLLQWLVLTEDILSEAPTLKMYYPFIPSTLLKPIVAHREIHLLMQPVWTDHGLVLKLTYLDVSWWHVMN